MDKIGVLDRRIISAKNVNYLQIKPNFIRVSLEFLLFLLYNYTCNNKVGRNKRQKESFWQKDKNNLKFRFWAEWEK
jgi:hypothetical protein